MAPFASRRLKIMNITMNIASAEKTTNITITKRENAAAVTIMDITMNIASVVKTMNITITRMRNAAAVMIMNIVVVKKVMNIIMARNAAAVTTMKLCQRSIIRRSRVN